MERRNQGWKTRRLIDDTGVQPAVLQEQGRGQDVLHAANLDCDLVAGKVDNSSQDSLNSESSHEGNIQSGDSDRGSGEGKLE